MSSTVYAARRRSYGRLWILIVAVLVVVVAVVVAVVGTEGSFSIRVVRTVYDGDRAVATATLRWTYDGLD